MWDQLHTDGRIAPDRLRSVVAARLRLDPRAVEVAKSAAEAKWAQGTKALLTVRTVGGELSNRIEVIFDLGFLPEVTREDLAAEIAKKLGVRVVRDDGTPDPYRGVLFRPNGEREQVSFDPTALDEKEQVVLAKPKPTQAAKPMASRPTTRKGASKETRAAELRQLREFYADAKAPTLPETKEQHASYGRLADLVFALRLPAAETEKNTLRAAVAEVHASWPKAKRELGGSTLETLLKGAAILLEE